MTTIDGRFIEISLRTEGYSVIHSFDIRDVGGLNTYEYEGKDKSINPYYSFTITLKDSDDIYFRYASKDELYEDYNTINQEWKKSKGQTVKTESGI